jgi:hypothetical protein
MFQWQGSGRTLGVVVLVALVLVLGYVGGDWLSGFGDRQSEASNDEDMWQRRDAYVKSLEEAESSSELASADSESAKIAVDLGSDDRGDNDNDDDDESGAMQGGPASQAILKKRSVKGIGISSIQNSIEDEDEDDEGDDEVETMSELRSFYAHYNPSHMGDVPTILAHFKGRYAVLYAKLGRKYGASPADFARNNDASSNQRERAGEGHKSARLEAIRQRERVASRLGGLESNVGDVAGGDDVGDGDEEEERQDEQTSERDDSSSEVEEENASGDEVDSGLDYRQEEDDEDSGLTTAAISASKTRRTKVKLICVGLDRTGLGAIRRFLSNFLKLRVASETTVMANLGPILTGEVANPEFDMFDDTAVIMGMASSAFFHELIR